MSASNFHAKSTALEVVKGLNAKLDGKVILITGATSGIGIETARALTTTNAHVFITGRDMNKGAEVVEDIKKTTGNAGIMACPYTKTVDGFESQFGVNHLAHFLLVTQLLPELEAGKPARVIVVSSAANKMGGINFDDVNLEKNYDRWLAYAQSKSANILFAKQFDKLYGKDGIHAYSLHPGDILTGLQKNVPFEEQKAMGWYKEDGTLIDSFKNIEQGASTTVYAALAPELDQRGGEYLEDCAISQEVTGGKEYAGMGAHATDMNAAERLWKLSEQMINTK